MIKRAILVAALGMSSAAWANMPAASCYVNEMGSKGLFSYHVILVPNKTGYETNGLQQTMNFQGKWQASLQSGGEKSRVVYFSPEQVALGVAVAKSTSVYLHTDLSSTEKTHRLNGSASITIDCRMYAK